MLSTLQLTGDNATVTLDSSLRLQSVGACPWVTCLSRGSASVAEAGAGAYVSWGRWTAGNAAVHILGVPAALSLNSQQGIHYVVGVPTVSMPTTGTFSYSLLGATSPTISDGSLAPGSFDGRATVQFAAGLQTRVGLEARITIASSVITFSAPMTSGPPAGLSMTSASAFAGTLTATGPASNNDDKFACAGTSCKAQIQGSFYGPGAAQMGLGYTLSGASNPTRTISGVAVLQKGP